MNRTKPQLYKRIIAYIIDLLVVTLLAGIVTMMFTDTKEYDKYSKEALELTEKIVKEDLPQEEFREQFKEINYNLTKSSVNVTIITIVTSIVYYVVMCYFCHGITLGKSIMKLRIVSANEREINIFHYLLRSLIVNSILSNVVTIIMIYTLSKQTFININDKVNNVFTLILIITFIVMMYREDGRGLHDLLGNTKVIDIKYQEENNEESKDTVEEAKVIEEKTSKKKGRKKEGN